MKARLKQAARSMGVELMSRERAARLSAIEADYHGFIDVLLRSARKLGGTSQLGQDLFVLLETGFKRDGFFVEFGATNGVDLSNTWLLEKAFGWSGILAEPAVVWHADLHANRAARIVTDCVWSDSGRTVEFAATQDPALSTIRHFSASDLHAAKRTNGQIYQVTTISLRDLLAKHQAPRQIDYLSIDTEGSEYEIIRHFDFDEYEIKIMTVEHNHTPARQQIFDLLTAKGYERRFEALSRWDDWYVRR